MLLEILVWGIEKLGEKGSYRRESGANDRRGFILVQHSFQIRLFFSIGASLPRKGYLPAIDTYLARP
jgi:hypothetical protein